MGTNGRQRVLFGVGLFFHAIEHARTGQPIQQQITPGALGHQFAGKDALGRKPFRGRVQHLKLLMVKTQVQHCVWQQCIEPAGYLRRLPAARRLVHQQKLDIL
ncbi:hypothetical protein ULF88_07370 [Halopseudomonas pachastrellae]|nr:hypothetical protein [Halopseudomonas pachastrellae]